MKTGIIILAAAVGGAAIFALFASPDGESQPSSAEVSPAAEPATPAQAPNTDGVLTGTAAEVIQVPGYTYLAIEQGGQTKWAAVSTAQVEKGTPVAVKVDTVMSNFKSSTLNRTFDAIAFGSLSGEAAAGSPHAGMNPQAGNPHAGLNMAQKEAIKVAKVEKAEGGYTIEELYAKRQELEGKTVRVRGVVTKALDGIMGKTFAHLGDGSGSPEAKNNDLTVTMTETPNQGDEVTVEGKVVLNKDVGAGYKYDLLLEQAKIVSK